MEQDTQNQDSIGRDEVLKLSTPYRCNLLNFHHVIFKKINTGVFLVFSFRKCLHSVFEVKGIPISSFKHEP